MSDQLETPVTGPTLIGFHADRIASGVLICAADGVIVDCNRTAAEIMRLGHDTIVGRTVADLSWLPAPPFFEDGRSAGRFGETALHELRAGLSVAPTVVGAWHDDRSEPDWILVSAHPLPPDERGRATGAVVTLTDITAQKCVETLYASVVDELHGVLHALPDLYFRLDPDGFVIDFNIGSGFDEHVNSDDFLGRRPDEFLPAEVAAGMRKARAESLLARDVQAFEVTLETPQAGTSCFEGRHVTLPDGGAVVIVRDMTEQRRARDELRPLGAPLSVVLRARGGGHVPVRRPAATHDLQRRDRRRDRPAARTAPRARPSGAARPGFHGDPRGGAARR